MIYQGRELDVLSLWGEHIDLPNNIGDPLPTFLPKVQCPNPAHDTHKHHFQVNTRKPMVHCFANCGISGTYEHAIATILDLRDTKGRLDDKAARRVILKHTRTSLGKVASAYSGRGVRKSVDPDSAVATDERALAGGSFQFLPKEVRAYLDLRGIDASSRGKWQLGWCEESERLVIPAYDDRGVFRFLIKRKLTGGGNFKYLYTDGAIKTSILFGANFMDREMLRTFGMSLVEGSLDVIRVDQLGFPTAGGILGTGLSRTQVRLIDKLGPRRVYLFFDKDGAGADNIADAKLKITKRPLFVVRFPKHRGDPAEMTREEVARAFDRALPIHEFYRKARSSKLTRRVFA